jgi:hypothetical protein
MKCKNTIQIHIIILYILNNIVQDNINFQVSNYFLIIFL